MSTGHTNHALLGDSAVRERTATGPGSRASTALVDRDMAPSSASSLARAAARRRQKRRRRLLALVLLSAAAIAAAWRLWPLVTEADADGAPTTETVARRDFAATVLATGAVRPQIGAEVRVGARISGKVERLPAMRTGSSCSRTAGSRRTAASSSPATPNR
jgi:hypothetical protein